MNLAARIFPLALGAAVSPTMLGVVLLLLAAKEHGKRLAIAFTVGAAIPLAVISVVVLTLWHAAATKAAHPNAVAAGIDLAFGLVLLLFGLRTMITAPAQHAPKERALSTQVAFVLGLAIMATNFSSLLLVMPALKEVSGATASFGAKAVAVFVIELFTMLPVLVPLGIATVAPGPSARMFASLRGFVTRYERAIGVVLCFVFGVYLMVKGARGF